MIFERLFRDVPTIEEWASAHINLADLTLADLEKVEEAYLQEFAVTLPASDEDGWPTMPPDDHIIDGFARSWIPGGEEAAAQRAGFGTVAVVAERIPCDICHWGSARYESRVGARRDFAALCLCCLVQRGDPILGPGHSIMLLLPDAIPDRVRNRLLPHIAQDAMPSWTRNRSGDRWDAYRRWGFTGPDESGRLYATILNSQLSVQLGPLDSVEIVARAAGTRHLYEPGGDTHYAPSSQDDLDVRVILMRVLRREFSTGRGLEECDRYFEVKPTERDERAMDALARHGGDRWLRLGEHLFGESGDYQMSVAAASESQSPAVVASLARSHPDFLIRRAAIANPALEPHVLAHAAADRDEAVVGVLLEREDLPPESTAQAVETLLLAGSLNHDAMLVALKRSDFPDRLLETAIERVSADGTQWRIHLAEAIHDAPAHRRDLVHLQLLRRARKIKTTLGLLDAVIGTDADRAVWLAAREEWKIRDLIAWREDQRAAPETGAESPLPKDSSPATTDPLPHPPAPNQSSMPFIKLTASAVSARLRRWWLTEAMADEELLASDIGDALDQCRLVRVASVLHVNMPYDFGTGSPVPPDVDRRLTDRVAELSGDVVRGISWSFTGSAKPTTRKRSSGLDVYEPGDPLFDDWPSVAQALAKYIVGDADERALAPLRELRLAGVSRHRICLALPTAESVRGIGTTPGAAATLKIAAAKFQGRKHEEALYDIVADPDPEAPRLPLL